MQITGAWLIYILVIIVVYGLLTFANCRLGWSNITRLLVAFLLGLIAVLVLIPAIQTATENERTLYSLLLILGFIVPLGLALWMAWKKNLIPGLEGTDASGCKTESEYSCNGDSCQISRKKTVCPNSRNGAPLNAYAHRDAYGVLPGDTYGNDNAGSYRNDNVGSYIDDYAMPYREM